MSPLSAVLRDYSELYRRHFEGVPAVSRAEVPDDPERMVQELKAACHFLDADMVGATAALGCWREETDAAGHAHALVILVADPRLPEADNLAHGWVEGAADDAAAVRATEIAVVIAGYVRRLGWSARVHDRDGDVVDLRRLSAQAGLAIEREGEVVNPFVGNGFALAAVTTDLPLAHDQPLAPEALGAKRWLGWWLGFGGAEPGFERWRRGRRASHHSAFPMERIRRVDRPTTLILEDEIPRVPKRAAFFERALRGDLGPKAQQERTRFATKHPFSHAMTPLISDMVPLQDGPVAARAGGPDDSEATGADATPVGGDPAANARAIKSLSYFLGADLTGICEVPRYAWYSHGDDGKEIPIRHRYAVVMLIDQGHDTMEGSSGDDWISGAQSMRAYLRGAAIAGQMAQLIRGLGHPARAQTNRDSDVLQIPLILLAGLGEMSRIGELVLNPFVGPRFKSVVLTTDLPLEADRPIDFGLQDMCAKCQKCARECPCDAIPAGPKVMFNGYEIWKPDVQRCTSYRLTNMRGSACGRCMKTCPYNHEGLLMHRLFLWMAIHLPFARRWIAHLDDKLRNGDINPIKRWWLDFEVVGEKVRVPKLANARNLDLGKVVDPAKQRIAHYPASMMPPPDQAESFALDRKQALAMTGYLETPDRARRRSARGDPPPDHYRPTPPIEDKA